MNRVLIATGVLFLTQAEAPKYGVTLTSVDPERFDASIETAVYRELPARHLVHTWHVMDSRVFQLVPNASPSRWGSPADSSVPFADRLAAHRR